MNLEVRIQDPEADESVFLLETLIECLDDCCSLTGVWAFASVAGIDMLVNDPSMSRLLEVGKAHLIVGIDAITDKAALLRLRELTKNNPNITASVFRNRTRGLFHPKMCEFVYGDGSKKLVIGSGNLTPGGLRDNFEAYSIAHLDPPEAARHCQIMQFLADKTGCITGIDKQALERAGKNRYVGRRRRRIDLEPDVTLLASSEEVDAPPDILPLRILIATVPRGSVRWRQVGFNKYVIGKFFRLTPGRKQRVWLNEVRPDGSRGEPEQRPLVYSEGSNRNMRLELHARAGFDFSAGDLNPVAVFKEIQLRTFDYMLLFPDDEGYSKLRRYLLVTPSVGKGHPRVITNAEKLQVLWPKCPLLQDLAPDVL